MPLSCSPVVQWLASSQLVNIIEYKLAEANISNYRLAPTANLWFRTEYLSTKISQDPCSGGSSRFVWGANRKAKKVTR